MATTPDFIDYVCDQLRGVGDLRSRKMFGEYMIYVNDKPILTVCNNTVYIKKLDCLADLLHDAKTGCPYQGAKEHYILDVDRPDLACEAVSSAEKVTPLPKPKKKKASH